MAPTLYDDEPKPGDLIEIFRGTYQHWVVYIGDGFVVHLAPPSEVAGAGCNSMMSVFAEKAIVKREGLWDVLGTHSWKINNSLDDRYKPRSASEIVRNARALVGMEMQYSVFSGNCEHFANELRYGKAESRQVQTAGEIAMAAGVATVFGLGVVALASALFGRNKNEHKDKQ